MTLIETIQSFFVNLWEVSLEAGPWLVLGLVFAGLIKVFIPPDWMARWLGKKGFGSVLRAALIGIPLPLCSCGVLPAAVGIRKQGASKGATISFLVATPQNGVDSIFLSYALLGPFLAIVRPIASLFSALLAGVCSDVVDRAEDDGGEVGEVKSCCASKNKEEEPEVVKSEKKGCCGSEDKQEEVVEKGCCDEDEKTQGKGMWGRVVEGLKFAGTDILDDISKWLGIGLVLAALITTFVSEDQIAGFGSGIGAMLMMTLIGVPMYICASASTPLAASLLMVGVSPGTVLVFLLAGPATNIAGLAVVKKTLGLRVCAAYLVGIIVGAIGSGLVVDHLMSRFHIEISEQMAHAHFVPHWLELVSVVLLLVFAVKPVRKVLLKG